MNLKSVKTLLLGLAVLLITFSVFVALPAVVPSFKDMSCEKLLWACSYRGMEPVRYTTYIWDEYIFPEESIFRGKIKVEPVTNSEDMVIVSGYLMYGEAIDIKVEGLWFPSFDWKGGLVNRRISIKIRYYYEESGVTRTEEYEITTGAEGRFSFKLLPDKEAICYGITGMYPGEIIIPYNENLPVEIYHPCKGSYINCPPLLLEEQKKSLWWVWLISGLLILSLAAVIYWYVRHRRGYLPERELLPLSEELEDKHKPEKNEIETGGNTDRVEILFSDIEESMPGVLGMNEVLKAVIKFKDKNCNVLHLQPGTVDWGDGDTNRFVTEEKATAIPHVYHDKGEFTITAGYRDKTGKDVSSWRRIRIVDYREEMVRLFSEMLESLNVADLKIEPDMTPREVERLLIDKLEGVSKESIRRVIDGFEEANYSTHLMNRESYVRMYRAIQEIKRTG